MSAMKSTSVTMGHLRWFLLSAIVVLAAAVQAHAQSPEALAQQIQETYADIESISFSFSQTTGGQIAGRPKTGKGTAVFARIEDRNMMRWNYVQPEPQVVLSDGISISMYFEKLNQMIITSVDKAQADILFSFFTASEPLSDRFSLLPPEGNTAAGNAGTQVLQLQPLEAESQIKSIHLWLDEDSVIRRIQLLDHFDTRTTINLSMISINPLDSTNEQDIAKRFTFVPPEGTEIIRQ